MDNYSSSPMRGSSPAGSPDSREVSMGLVGTFHEQAAADSTRSQRSQSRSVTDIISEKHAPFDHQTLIVEPFEAEERRDADFQRELNRLLLFTLVEAHAWAVTRPNYENERATLALEHEITSVIETEKEQGRSPSPSSSPWGWGLLAQRCSSHGTGFHTRITMSSNAQHCSFVLLAEFDIDRGAQLTYQFPQPLGTDEGLLANLMLPDGAEKQLEDWTVFFLNQTPFNTIAPVLALEESTVNGHDQDGAGRETDKPELLYVLNLVRTKHDKTVRRCCRKSYGYMHAAPVYRNVQAPKLNRHEKLIMRHSERKDVFAEKFFPGRPSPDPSQGGARTSHRPMPSNGSHSSFEEGILQRTKERVEGRERAGTEASIRNPPPPAPSTQYSPSENSFSLGGSAVWVGDESGLLEHAASLGGPSSVGSNGSSVTASKGRRSTDASSSSSHGQHRGIDHGYGGATPMIAGSSDPHLRAGMMKDTHFFQTTIDYKGHQLPIKMPLSTFPEEVGDYSLIQLIQTFSNPAATTSGPLHPHLHTNGSLTHPIILLFNALVTGKRIIFLGHNRPAREVSSYVLSACALGSGCGTILRGFIERAFPYANLINREEWESIPAYIAGVTNPIFESSGSWDLLCDVGTGRMIVSKDIHISCPPQTSPSGAPPLITRSGTLRAESSVGSEDDIGRVPGREKEVPSQKSDFVAKADNPDNVFIEDIITAINYHFGESTVRARFTDYVQRFVRLASKYEEDVLGLTTIGYPSASFNEGHGDHPQLGSGIVFIDEGAGQRELAIHASRIEGWRRTKTYQYFQQDFERSLRTNALQGFDVMHQLWRLRHAKNMNDLEVELIMRSMAENVQTYDQVVELLALSPPHSGGLLPLSYGLFHQQELVRDLTVDLFNQLRVFPVGVQFLQALNHFQRYAYVRQAHARENRMRDLAPPAQAIPPHMTFSRTSSYGNAVTNWERSQLPSRKTSKTLKRNAEQVRSTFSSLSSTMSLTVAMQYLVSFVPILLGPPLATCIILRQLVNPTILFLITSGLLSIPVAVFLSVQWKLAKDRRDAARLGAVLAPVIEDSNILGLNTVKSSVMNYTDGYMGEHIVNWANRYGWTFNTKAFFEDKYQTMEPDNIKAILASSFSSFEKGPLFATQMRDLFGTGVFNSDVHWIEGELWKFHRSMTRPFFTRERLSDFDMFDRHAQEAIRLLRERLREGQPVDFQDLASRFTLDTATDFLFGSDVRSLSAGLPYPSSPLSPCPKPSNEQHPANTFARAFLQTQSRLALRSRYGHAWPLYELFDGSVARNMRTVRGYVDPIVAKALERAEANQHILGKTDGQNMDEVETLLDHLVAQTRDPVILRDETLNILLAGRDTTASTLTSTIYALSQHPEVLARLRAEILENIGPDRAPTLDDFRVCKYLRAVINEVLRLWPAVPFNIRRSTEPVVWPANEHGGKPIYVPAGTKCAYSVMLMHRRADLWGPDATRFDPDRFLDQRLHKYLIPNPFIFLPFNGGPRICLGQQFAYNEVSFFIVRLLQSFDSITLDLDAQPPSSLAPWNDKEKIKFKTHLTLYWEGGMWVHMREGGLVVDANGEA
ncbi:hypothetical protein EVG20_g3200 [Dentipellis fragilis]|uniref:Arf3-interacting protein 1 N-terminal domain-containing protein n=1 Tax=Dentipellis fragilis TaxID=205917 RepID=A0A4Y9Z3V8_9AGAM|nr:hypothetical protein EVG20_g3200 [Dentipellis fragilis]